MFFICISMYHDIVGNYIGSRIDVMKVNVRVILEEVLHLVKTKWHLNKAKSAPWGIERSQQL